MAKKAPLKKSVAKKTSKPAAKAAKNTKATKPVKSSVVKAKANQVREASSKTVAKPEKSITATKKIAVKAGKFMKLPQSVPQSVAPADQAARMAEGVPTDGKPRKNQAGLLTKDLEQYRDALLAKRRELLGDVRSMESEALRSSGASNLSSLPIHMADMGTDNYEQEFTLGLVEKDRVLLREINQALAKIQNGTFGLCEGTGKPIAKPRLEAQPWARFSIEHAREMEKRMGR